MGKKKRRLTSPKYANKCSLKRATHAKLKGLTSDAPTTEETLLAEEQTTQTVQVVELKKETTPEPVLETEAKPVVEKKTEPVNKKSTTAKKKPTAKKRSTKAKSTRSTKKPSTKD